MKRANQEGFDLNIAFVAPYFLPYVGGIETYVYELTKRLSEKGIGVQIFTSGNGTVRELGKVKVFGLRSFDFKDFPFPVKIPYPIPLSLVSKLARADVDLIHAHGHAFASSFAGALASRLVGKPFVLTVHDIGASYLENLLVRGVRPLFDSTLADYVFRHADMVITLNDVTLSYAARYRPRKAVIVPQGIDIERFRTEKEGEYVTFIAARLVPIKGGETFIRTIPYVLEKVKYAKFRVVGDGIQRPFLEELSRKLGVSDHVSFMGRIDYDKMPACLGEAKIVVFTGYSGFILLEAAAARRSIITIETAWSKDALGDTPLFVPYGSPYETAKAIICLLGSPNKRKNIAELAYRKVVSGRDWNTVVSEHIKLYEQIVRENACS